MWNLITTAHSLLVSMNAASSKACCSTLALHHSLFSVALMGNLVVVVAYWSLIHKEFIISEYVEANPMMKNRAYTMLTVPGLAILYVFC